MRTKVVYGVGIVAVVFALLSIVSMLILGREYYSSGVGILVISWVLIFSALIVANLFARVLKNRKLTNLTWNLVHYLMFAGVFIFILEGFLRAYSSF